MIDSNRVIPIETVNNVFTVDDRLDASAFGWSQNAARYLISLNEGCHASMPLINESVYTESLIEEHHRWHQPDYGFAYSLPNATIGGEGLILWEN